MVEQLLSSLPVPHPDALDLVIIVVCAAFLWHLAGFWDSLDQADAEDLRETGP